MGQDDAEGRRDSPAPPAPAPAPAPASSRPSPRPSDPAALTAVRLAAVAVPAWVLLRFVKHKRMWALRLAVLAALVAHSLRLEAGPKRYFRGAQHAALLAVFMARKGASVALDKLVLGGGRQPYWNWLETMSVKTINFAAHVGHVSAPRFSLGSLAALQRFVGPGRGVHWREVDLGLAVACDEGEAPAPRSKADAMWVTLDPSHEPGSIPTILFYHGGGFCVGSADMALLALGQWLRSMAQDFGMVAGILSIEYPLAPETKFPHNVAFACDAYDAVVGDLRVPLASLVIAGDSAGGAMAFAVARHAGYPRKRLRPELGTGSLEEGGKSEGGKSEGGRSEGSPGAAGIVLVCPWVDHATGADSHEAHMETDLIAGAHILEDYSLEYCGCHEKAAAHPEISVTHSAKNDLDFLPPAFVTVGAREVFGDDIEAFVKKLRDAGKHVEDHYGADCPHIYPLLWPLFEHESTTALRLMAGFCAKRFRAGMVGEADP